jgi:3-hydroxyisobutyrate dehydrogenase-like beta-hydroxyacid dehydrogenase
MGLALARALARAGHTVTVWNRTASRAEPLQELGVAVADSAASACEASAVVVVSVTDYEATLEMLAAGIGSVLEGRTFVQLSSGAPSEAREMARWAAERRIGYLDGKIVGFPSAIGTSDAVIFYAGSADTFAATRPILSDLSAAPMHVGEDAGHPAIIDGAIILNMMAIFVANMIGRAMCDAEGVVSQAWTLFGGMTLDAAPQLIFDLNASLDRKDYTGAEASLTTWARGADLIRDGLAERGLDTTLAGCIADLAHRAIERGRGDDGFAAIYSVLSTAHG